VADRYETLFRQHYDELHRLAWRVLGNDADADEVASDALAKLADAPVLRRPDGEVRAWLRRVCLNDSFNRLRTRRRALARADRLARLDGPVSAASPLATVLRREQQAEVRDALARLPDRQRDCLLLRHSGYRYAEIAATLGIAVGSVGVLLARAERAFRLTYEEHSHDELS
jgi:RNA polymerase sigma factor (sigma-70 family)